MKSEGGFVAEDSLAVRPQPQSHEVLTLRRRKMDEPINTSDNALDSALSAMIAKQLVGIPGLVRLGCREITRLAYGRLIQLFPLLDDFSAQN